MPKLPFPGLVNFVPAVAYHFSLASPAAFTQPGDRLLAEPCTHWYVCFEKASSQQHFPKYVYPGSTAMKSTHCILQNLTFKSNVSVCNNQSRAVMEYWTWENPHRLTTFDMTLTYYQENSRAFQTASLIDFIQSNILLRTGNL